MGEGGTTSDSPGTRGLTLGKVGVGGRSASANSVGTFGAAGTFGRSVLASARSRGVIPAGLCFVLTNSASVRSPGERELNSELRVAAGEPKREWRLAPAPGALAALFQPFSRPRSSPSETAISARNPAAIPICRRRLLAVASAAIAAVSEVPSSCAISPLTRWW